MVVDVPIVRRCAAVAVLIISGVPMMIAFSLWAAVSLIAGVAAAFAIDPN
jgi:hypothetical protein